VNSVFTMVEPGLQPILDELRRREPIFHSPEFGLTTADFERSTEPDFWEVGASGRRYSPLKEINTTNVKGLTLEWSAKIGAGTPPTFSGGPGELPQGGGQVAPRGTPLLVNGVLFAVVPNAVYAVERAGRSERDVFGVYRLRKSNQVARIARNVYSHASMILIVSLVLVVQPFTPSMSRSRLSCSLLSSRGQQPSNGEMISFKGGQWPVRCETAAGRDSKNHSIAIRAAAEGGAIKVVVFAPDQRAGICAFPAAGE